MKLIARIIWNLLAVIGLISIISGLFMLYVDDKLDLSSGVEESRLSSPNSEYDAVIVKYEPMAFSTPNFSLFIVPHGEKYSEASPNFQHGNFRGTGLSIKNVSWKNDRNLVIRRWPRANIDFFEPIHHDLSKPIELETHTDYEKVYIDLITD